MITHPFNIQISQMTAHEFVSRLQQHLGMTHLCIGHDFALGKNREGNAQRLQELSQDLGFSVTAIPAMVIDGDIVSSSLIRNLLSLGRVESIERYLGRKYQITGKVVPGDHRGKQLGFPTANLETWAERAIPKAGVYACRVMVDGESREAVTNVGVRPTFENTPVAPRVEAHLINFNGNLYGKIVDVEFIARLRDELKFNGIKELVDQIHSDINVAQNIFNHK
jgi:riboflavin kinase/FMN adenylyltransferase